MMNSRVWACVAGVCLLAGPAAGAESLQTVRFGEQDSCKVTGVTKHSYDRKAGGARIRFDLSGLGKDTKVARALLRFWVPGSREFGFGRWKEKGFAGFKVYAGGEPDEAKLLDTRYPFNAQSYWLFEFDVTAAVKQWVADAAKNDGLLTNFAFPAAPAEKGKPSRAWLKPYLEVTFAGPNADRPRQVSGLKAVYRSGQVFLTWKQAELPVAFHDQTFGVYRSAEPITAANLDRAELLGEVHRLSQLNYRRSVTAIGSGHSRAIEFYANTLVRDGKLRPAKKGEDRKAFPARYLAAMPERFNFVIDAGWAARRGADLLKKVHAPAEDQGRHGDLRVVCGPELSDDTGVFVQTVRRAGPACFAVTAVVDGNENRRDVSAANSVGPIAVKVQAPRPVLQAVFNHAGRHGPMQIREYAYWGGPAAGFHNTPSTAFCFSFKVPTGHALTHDGKPARGAAQNPWLYTDGHQAGYGCHYWQISTRGSGAAVRMDTRYQPPTRNAPFPPGRVYGVRGWEASYAKLYYGSRTPPAGGGGAPGFFSHNIYGYMDTMDTGEDPRTATVHPYLENRRLFELDFVLSQHPELAGRVVPTGQSGAMMFGIHHGERFACVAASQEYFWNSPRGGRGKEIFVGLREWKLTNPEGFSPWDWMDPIWYSRQFPLKEWPFIVLCHSSNYDSADSWGAMGYPEFLWEIAKEKRGGDWVWVDIGDAPAPRNKAVPRDQAYLALTNATCGHVPVKSMRLLPRGTLNYFIEWHRPARPFMLPWRGRQDKKRPTSRPAPPDAKRPLAYVFRPRPTDETVRAWAAVKCDLVDEPARFEVALNMHEKGYSLNGQSLPPSRVHTGAVDVTPRRLQRFKVARGKKYQWRNVRVSTGEVLQAGVIAPDEKGLLTVPQFFVDKDVLGNKLVITPAGGAKPPPVKTGGKVTITYFATGRARHHMRPTKLELSWADYVARCKAPEVIPVVRSGRVFKVTDFVNRAGFRGAGLYTQWGGGFDDVFHFPRPGPYRVEVETTKAYFQNGAWPLIGLTVDNRKIGDRQIDSTEPYAHTWWFDLAEGGSHRVVFRLENNVFNEPVPRHGDQNPKPDRGFTVLGVCFTRLDPAPPRPSAPHLVKVRTRSVRVGAGMPVRMLADVRDASGRTLPAKVTWTASEAAKIDAGGVFSAGTEGAYTVAAESGGKSDSVEVRVRGEAWCEDFDDEWADGWSVMPTAADGEKDRRRRPAWSVTRKSTGFVGTLIQRGQAATAMVWDGGADWADYVLTADRIPDRKSGGLGGVQGVVFRYADADNHYRFEKSVQRKRVGKEHKTITTFRLLKRAGGKQTVLASEARTIKPLAVDPKTYGTFKHWGRRPESFEVDRFEVTVRGGKIAARFNSEQVLTAADDALKSGTVGVCCEGPAAFDNITVAPLK